MKFKPGDLIVSYGRHLAWRITGSRENGDILCEDSKYEDSKSWHGYALYVMFHAHNGHEHVVLIGSVLYIVQDGTFTHAM